MSSIELLVPRQEKKGTQFLGKQFISNQPSTQFLGTSTFTISNRA